MGVSASTLLDEAKSNYIRGEAEAELKKFSPYYRKQFCVARFCQVEEELDQNQAKTSQLLKQKGPPKEGEVLYEEAVFYFDDNRKWKERYVVVRASYCLECHESLETFVKGVPPRDKLLPTGGTVLTTEEAYMALVDRCFPDDSGVKEDFAPPLSGMPGQFPVYLRLPYRRDWYFCFRQEDKQASFISFLSDCIRHQNQDFLKKKTCEVQAFLRAIQQYRQDQDQYQAWDMLIGSDVRVLSNLVMEKLLPSLQKDLLPRLKARRNERRRLWFAMVEEAYILIQEHLLERLSELKEDCRACVREQEVLIHSDMDPILNTRRQLEEKIRVKVSEQAEKLCLESVQPYLGSVLEEMMEPISSGFLEGRQLSETKMNEACQEVLQSGVTEQLKEVLAEMARPNLLSSYQQIGSLQNVRKHLQERFSFSNTSGVIHSAQLDLQQLIENAAHTFQLLLYTAVEENPENAASAIEKAKHRVLKQYDYDSSTVRKRIFQDALVSITLPFIKKNLASTCRTELQGLEQMIYSDHSNFIHVENVYENVLLEILDKDISKVVKEAASLHKHNLFTESSRPSLSTPPGSPAPKTLPPSPLTVSHQRAPRQEEGAKASLEAQTITEGLETKRPAETWDTGTTETVIQDLELPVQKAGSILSQGPPTDGQTMKSKSPDPTEEPRNPPEEEAHPQSAAVQLGVSPGGEVAEVLCMEPKEVAKSVQSPNSSEGTGEDKTVDEESTTGQEPVLVQVGHTAAGTKVEDTRPLPSSESPKEKTHASPKTHPPDCVKVIRDLVVEVIEVEDQVQHYPKGD